MQARAVVSEAGRCEVVDVEVREPRAGEVLVAIKASGVCHTDYDILQLPYRFVLGHEGAGVVEAVGPGVEAVTVGDRVLLNWAMPCGRCAQCALGNQHLCERQSPLVGSPTERRSDATLDGKAIRRAFDLGTMSTRTVVRVDAVVPFRASIPFTSASIMGCGVMTGFGSVINVAKVQPGCSVVVIGCGGVGLSMVQAARLAGARPMIAVDRQEERLELARRFGATDVLVPRPDDDELAGVADDVRRLTGGRGADYAFESTGVPALAVSPLRMIRHGGMAVQVSGTEQVVPVDMRLFEFDKTYINPLYGQCSPGRDFPRLFDLYARGDLLLDEMVTATYALDDVGEAFADMLTGGGAKRVLTIG